MELKEKIAGLSEELFNQIVEIRRHIHKNPEAGFEEYKTAEYISDILTKYKIEHIKGIAGTGILASIEGHADAGTENCIALRAEMDALPINENKESDYKSQTPGLMHACGHDVHIASMLGTAIILNKLKEHINGTIKIIFQPSEEKLPGGASAMIKEGVLLNPTPKAIIAQHVLPELEAGKAGFRQGYFMASADEIYITVNGRGGHAARPDNLTDPILIASHIIIALQQLVSRKSNPFSPCVLSFGRITGDGQTNIIPDKVEISGTLRTFNDKWRKEAHELIDNMVCKIAESMEGSCDVRIVKGFPPLYNEPKLTARLYENAAKYLGNENITEVDMRMTAEDFAFFASEIPACFYRLGSGNELKGIKAGLHTSEFDIDEDILFTGMGLMAWLAINELSQ